MTQRAEVRVSLGGLPKVLSPNARGHWTRVARAKRELKKEAAWSAVAAMGRFKLRWPAATVDIVARFKEQRYVWDEDNIIAALKAAFDGLEIAGVFENDRRLTIGSVVRVVDPDHPGVLLIVKEGSIDAKPEVSDRAGHRPVPAGGGLSGGVDSREVAPGADEPRSPD